MTLAELCTLVWDWPVDFAELAVAVYRRPTRLTPYVSAWDRVNVCTAARGVFVDVGYVVGDDAAFKEWCIEVRREYTAGAA